MGSKNNKKIIFAGIIGAFICLYGCGMFSSDTEADASTVSVEEGDHIHMGSWHDEEIEWRVLDIEGDQVLLLSEYVLDVQPYHDVPCDSILWEDCTLRQWLNGTFYEGAFTDEEREQIIPSWSEGFIFYNVPNEEGIYSYRERETEDCIFVLSYTEIREYFKIVRYLDNHEGDPAVLCSPTEYVKNNCDIKIYTQGDNDYCGWWLGGGIWAGGDPDTVWPLMITEFSTSSRVSPEEIVYSGVRPAMWITWQEE